MGKKSRWGNAKEEELGSGARRRRSEGREEEEEVAPQRPRRTAGLQRQEEEPANIRQHHRSAVLPLFKFTGVK